MNASLLKLERRMQTNKTLLCVGLDSDLRKIPSSFLNSPTPQFDFNRSIIEQTHDLVSAYKPNLAFYEARGEAGLHELKLTLDYLHDQHPDIFTIADAKRADIGNTNLGYATAIFDWLGFDAVTLHPYLGQEALQPFLDRQDKTSIILCRTSNPGAGEFQDLVIDDHPLWYHVAQKVAQEWNTNGNCMLVVGATYPAEMQRIRTLVGEMTFLVPGIGAQGGDVKKAVRAGRNSAGLGLIINSARDIIFATNPRAAALTLRDAINAV
jgi:orotidine-5'-phosphate decarboxylase